MAPYVLDKEQERETDYLRITVVFGLFVALVIFVLPVVAALWTSGTASPKSQVSSASLLSPRNPVMSGTNSNSMPGIRFSAEDGPARRPVPQAPHPSGALPSASLRPLTGANAGSSVPPADWDEQIGLTFSPSYTSMAWNVTAVPQSGSYGYGPAYLLNGLTDQGWWYQVGLTYDWPYLAGGYASGFRMFYEVWNTSYVSVFPAGGGGGLFSFNGPVNAYDTVGLDLYFSGTSVIMTATDWDTGASATATYTAHGSVFVGSGQGGYTSSNYNGFFTGLMTEEYHVNQYFGDEQPTHYLDQGYSLPAAWMWADEYNPYTGASSLLFFEQRQANLASQSSAFSYLSTNGTNQFAAANLSGGALYITGASGITVANLGYYLIGGSQVGQPPSVTVTANGYMKSFPLDTTPEGVVLPRGATWSAEPELQASSAERWATERASGVFSTPYQDLVLGYYKQYHVTFGYNVTGGGSGYSPPQVTYSSFGSLQQTTSGSAVWADAGSEYIYPAQLPGSAASERWATGDTNGTVLTAGEIFAAYYHEYLVTFGFSVAGGGSGYAPPLVTYSNFGSSYTAKAGAPVWADAGSTYSYSHLLPGSGAVERWVAKGAWNGSVTQPSRVDVNYQRQFYVQFGTNDASAGGANPASGWYDAQAEITLSAVPDPGWVLHGWIGSGDGSYSGGPGGAVVVDGPVNETAIFYAGLTLSAVGQGSITYRSVSASGTISAGQSYTLYLPPGSLVNLSESPSSVLYSFSGWGGALTGSAGTASLTVSSPVAVQARFGYNYIVLALVAIILVAVVAGSALASRRRRSSGKQAGEGALLSGNRGASGAGSADPNKMPPPPPAGPYSAPATSPIPQVGSPTKYCIICGKPMPAESAFCPHCGSSQS